MSFVVANIWFVPKSLLHLRAEDFTLSCMVLISRAQLLCPPQRAGRIGWNGSGLELAKRSSTPLRFVNDGTESQEFNIDSFTFERIDSIQTAMKSRIHAV